ncbi:MAG: hypothetical protein AAF628_30770 [Planctomycetota bacterium]
MTATTISQLTEQLARGQRCAVAGDLHGARTALDHIPATLQTAALLVCRASVDRELGNAAAAREALAQAHHLSGNDALLVRRALTVPSIMQGRAGIETDRARTMRDFDALLAAPLRIDDPAIELPSLDFYYAYHGANDLPLRRKLGQLLRRACPSLAFVAPHAAAGAGPGPRHSRLRVGFASEHLRDHTIGHLNRALIAGLDPRRFETVALFLGGVRDAVATSIADTVAHRLDVPLELDQAREHIAGAELDALVYLDIGMGSFSYLLAHARLAPLQLASWGHPVTTGLDTVDGFLSSATEIDGADAHYAERLVRLPDPTVVYPRPTLEAPLRRDELGLPDDANLYLCPQSLFKLHPDFDVLLAEILGRDPRGVVVLLQPKYTAWRDAFLERLEAVRPGVGGRLLWLPPMPRQRYLALLAAGDVMLDPIHFGGGHTTLEALAMGTPVITWPSRLLRGRLTLSWYRALGLSHVAADRATDYVDTAVRLATDRAARDALRAELQARSGRLFGQRAAATALEHVLTRGAEPG